MMDDAFKTHKETTFGWVLLIQDCVAARKVRLARLAREQAAEAIRAAQATPRRYLAPR
jgi:predicted metal-dependent hydrolase